MTKILRFITATGILSCTWISSAVSDSSVVKIEGLQKAEVHFGELAFMRCGNRPARADFAGYTDDYYDIRDKDFLYLAEPATETLEVTTLEGKEFVKKDVVMHGMRVIHVRINRKNGVEFTIPRVVFEDRSSGQMGLYPFLEPPAISTVSKARFTLLSIASLKLQKPKYDHVGCAMSGRGFYTRYLSLKIRARPEPSEIWFNGIKTDYKVNTTLRFPETRADSMSLVLRRTGYATVHQVLETNSLKGSKALDISITLTPVP